ncbi:MAG: threonylcarbamoyl-AMP synthase [Alphaproteobacteria bacterium]|nr:threonylcarbamoyl-AMP synthase [Alphaproteobacteria bacterium]
MIERLTGASLGRAAELLVQGALVAFPTETVYGLGGDATNDRAVAAIFAAKERPQFNPLIVHVESLAAAELLAVFDERARDLARRFWPGPLSLVLKRRADCPVSRLASAGLDTVALRAPAHALAQALLRATGRPLAAPSANRSGHVSPTTADHVIAELDGRIAAVLDGGPCRVGIESTVLDVSEERPALLRPGGVTREQIEAALGPLAGAGDDNAPRSPGRLERHYAPARPLRLEATAVAADEALLAFGAPLPGAAETINLSLSRDLGEAAANLFAALRTLDQPRFKAIAVMPIPETGLGAAINDRLRRAARGRSN